jgi:NAD(P)-dependent dehydrogenase (short-subunit alcohol dehydrogenase family)
LAVLAIVIQRSWRIRLWGGHEHFNDGTEFWNLIVSISFFAAQQNNAGVAYAAAKAASDRMVAAMAYELREHSLAAVALYPGLVPPKRC